jgi:hypothetical protein
VFVGTHVSPHILEPHTQILIGQRLVATIAPVRTLRHLPALSLLYGAAGLPTSMGTVIDSAAAIAATKLHMAVSRSRGSQPTAQCCRVQAPLRRLNGLGVTQS